MLHINFDHAKQDFDRNGFVILRNYLSPAETAEMRQHLDDYLTHMAPPPHQKDKPNSSLKGIDQQDEWFHDYLENVSVPFSGDGGLLDGDSHRFGVCTSRGL